MLRFISLALCAATIASVALAGDGKPCDPKPGKAPCKAGAKLAGKKKGRPVDKKGAEDWKAGALAGRKACAEGGHKDCAEKAAMACKDAECAAEGHKKCRAEAAKCCEAKAKELAAGGGDVKKPGKCVGKGDVPGAKKPADAPCEKKKDAEPCEKKEGGDCKPDDKGDNES